MKKILIFSYNPVPTKQYTTVEGSGLRFWRMAKALISKGYNDITIAVWEKFPQEINAVEGVKLVNFNDNPIELKELCRGFDTAIFTCAMGNLSLAIYDAIDPNSRVIVDAYSPMYVEFLTKSQDAAEDRVLVDVYRGYAQVFDRILIGADHILIANDNQKHFYRGVLGGIGALPEHDDARFVHLPAFVEKDAHASKRIKLTDKVNVLWFGGVYPWFDISDVIAIFQDVEIQRLATLTIVGGSNPFYPKDNMRYNGKYIQAVETAKKHNLTDKVVFFKDWVQYSERIEKAFNPADIAISMNSDFIENEYSFRLRVADLVGNGVPILTNGGDFLGEELIKSGVAFKIDVSSKEKLLSGVKKVLSDRKKLEKARQLLRDDLFEDVHIDKYINNLACAIESDKPLRKKHDENIFIDTVDAYIDHPVTPEVPSITDISLDDIKNVTTIKIARVLGRRLRKSAIDRLRARLVRR